MCFKKENKKKGQNGSQMRKNHVIENIPTCVQATFAKLYEKDN